MAKTYGSYIREIAKIARQDLLILDRIVHDESIQKLSKKVMVT
jgi:hypothetical protein